EMSGESRGSKGKGDRMGDGNMRNRDSIVGAEMEMESDERGILIEGTIIGLRRNLVPGKLPGMHKDDPSYDSFQ
ncbi:hypothetical protein ACQP3J_29460, partial [Escherichia coli]